MGCDFDGNQQLVSVRDVGARRRWKVYMAPLLCVAVVLFLLLTARGGGTSVSPESEENAAEAHVESLLQGASNGPNERVQQIVNSVSGVGDEEAKQSSCTAFLDDLAQLSCSGAGTDGVVSVAWTKHDVLPVVAEQVLDSYRDAGGVKLVSAGYVDMKGRVWAALLQGDGAWVDVVAVSTEDDTASEVRVARLIGKEGVG